MCLREVFVFAFAFLQIICYLIPSAHGDDYSKDENLLYKFYLYKNELKWIWSVKPVCRILCPRGMNLQQAGIERKELILQSLGCIKISIEALRCHCLTQKPRSDGGDTFLIGGGYYVNGPNGEIYELGLSDEVRSDPSSGSFILYDDIIVNDIDKPFFNSKLRGVAQIFHAENALKSWRKSYRVESIDVVPDNPDDDDGDRHTADDTSSRRHVQLLRSMFSQ